MLTIRQFCDKYAWPKMGNMYMLSSNAKKLGLDKAFHRKGRNLMVRDELFFKLLRKRRGANIDKHLPPDMHDMRSIEERLIDLETHISSLQAQLATLQGEAAELKRVTRKTDV